MELKRSLKFVDVFCVATGAMISSGLFILPGLAHAQAGPAVVLSYLVAGLLAMTGMLSQAELVSAMPKAGGTYFYVTRSMGPALGTIDGLITWMSISLKSSFALVGMAAFTNTMAGWDPRLIAVILCVGFVVINFIGIKEAGMVQVGLVAFLILLLLIYIFAGIPAVDARNFRPFMPNGLAAVFSVSGFVFVSYGGLLKVSSIAEEVKHPAKVIPIAMIASLLVVSIFYAFVVFVTTGVMGSAQLDNSLTPITDGAGIILGEWGSVALSVAAILAFISTANAGIMAASRYPMALSRDHLLPDGFSRIHKRFKTPSLSIIVTGIFMIIALFLDLRVLVEVASTVLILSFIFSCTCVIIMRESGVQNYKPKFRSAFYPWMQIAGIFGCWLLVVNMGKEALFIGSFLFAAGLAVFWFYGRQRTQKDFALLHLIKKVAAREIVDITLEEELKEIIRERDDIIKDRFDRIIEKSIVLDLKGPVKMETFFGTIAKELASKLEIEANQILALLMEREKQASTVLSPSLAIPHMVLPGENIFIILMARCREGIVFPGAGDPVNMVFVIAGTKDERTFHLRALSTIAQIVENPNFREKWMKAEDPEALRDLILLGKRER